MKFVVTKTITSDDFSRPQQHETKCSSWRGQPLALELRAFCGFTTALKFKNGATMSAAVLKKKLLKT